MFLCDESIVKALTEKKISIEPFQEKYLRPSSVCFTLGMDLIVPDWPKNLLLPNSNSYPKTKEQIDLNKTKFFIQPNDFILGSTQEKISLSLNFAAVIFNISGLSRLGIEVCSSSLISPGFGSELPSTLTLEIYNKGKSTILLEPGIRICHIAFVSVDTESKRNYDKDVGIYSKQNGPKHSEFYKNWK